MYKILRKRVWRELKENIYRYVALALLIILGMYLIVSLVGAAETVIRGVGEKAEENKLEDGQFGVFVPLTKAEESDIKSSGVSLEQMFYLDFEMKDSSTLRVYKNRQEIDRIDLDDGRLAQNAEEAVLEKRYSAEHDLTIGDYVTIGGWQYRIVGTGSVPDYDAPYKDLSDSSVESKQFGLAFVTGDAYEALKNSGNSTKSEEFTYAYRLNGKMKTEELREKIQKLSFSPEDVTDSYFQDYWSETGGKKEGLEDGVQELLDGAENLDEALELLSRNNEKLQSGAGQILDAYLRETEKELAEYGLSQELTEDNFEEILGNLMDSTDNGILRFSLNSVLEQLRELKQYKEGVIQYTGGVAEAAKGAGELADGMQKLQEGTKELITDFSDEDMSNLTQFMKSEDNPRVKASADDQIINKLAGLIAGIIIIVLFTYVISVFVIHEIERESSVIGALYALGVKKRELISHYLMLPVMITFLAGLAGTILGYSKWGINIQMGDCYKYFSVPSLQVVYPVYLLIYGVVMPPVIAAVVNCIVIWKKLSQPALRLIRNEQKVSRISNINLGDMGFINRFRIRQMLREIRTGFTVMFGMFIALLIMMLGINCYVMCGHLRAENAADTRYEYMYTYKYPEEQMPEGGKACYARTFTKEVHGYNLEVTLLGVERDNPYFKANVTPGKSKAVISSAMAQKYQLSEGDELILTEEESETDYAFTVEGVVQYSVSFYAFMDIDSMRELFGVDDDYYNVIFSGHELDIDPGRLYAAVSREEIVRSAEIFIEMMLPMVMMLVVVSAIIFCVVMYLMMKVMIDRSAFSISLIKIFGYRTGEIRKLYLNGNFYMIAASAAVCIPLSKLLMDKIYPLLVSNVACGMNLSFSWELYLGIYGIIIGLYFVINQLLVRRLNKMIPVEVLKNRE